MRIRLHNRSISLGGNDTPCGNSGYGEVEDYSVTVGKVIRTHSTPTNAVVWDIQQLSAGVYLIKTRVNGALQTHKFVKK